MIRPGRCRWRRRRGRDDAGGAEEVLGDGVDQAGQGGDDGGVGDQADQGGGDPGADDLAEVPAAEQGRDLRGDGGVEGLLDHVVAEQFADQVLTVVSSARHRLVSESSWVTAAPTATPTAASMSGLARRASRRRPGRWRGPRR